MHRLPRHMPEIRCTHFQNVSERDKESETDTDTHRETPREISTDYFYFTSVYGNRKRRSEAEHYVVFDMNILQ